MIEISIWWAGVAVFYFVCGYGTAKLSLMLYKRPLGGFWFPFLLWPVVLLAAAIIPIPQDVPTWKDLKRVP
jgi:hypothetical protein